MISRAFRRSFASKPTVKPNSSSFGSGPCKKHPGYSISKLEGAALGRSHRSKLGKDKLALAITKSKEILGLPEGYELGIVPGSDTGAFEVCHFEIKVGSTNLWV